MVVLAVPSLPKKKHRLLYEAADKIAASLLDFRPEEFGLPPFDDCKSNLHADPDRFSSGTILSVSSE
jgi:hypothetical protein